MKYSRTDAKTMAPISRAFYGSHGWGGFFLIPLVTGLARFAPTHLKKTSILSLLTALTFIVGGHALATPQIGVTSMPLADGTFEAINVRARTDLWRTRVQTNAATDLHVLQNTVIPGGTFGWHSHTGPSLVIVLSGAATMYEGDDPTCSPHVLQAPATFVDEGSPTGHLVRNEGNVDLVVFVVRLVPAGAVQRIDLPNPHPGVCPE